MAGQRGRLKGGRIRHHLYAHCVAWCLVAAIGLGIALRFRLLSVPLERDEGEYAYAGQLMLQGIAPYDLAYTMKLPGVSAVYAGMMLIFGQTHIGIHLGLLLINALTSFLVFLIGRRLVGPLAGVSAAAFFALTSTLSAVQGLWANAEHFVLPFALLGILTFLHWLQDRRNRFLVVSGALLGCGILMKQHAVAYMFFVLACLLWELFIARTGHWMPPGKAVASLLGGAALPLILMALTIHAMGSFDKLLFWTTEYATSYTTGNSFERGWFNLLRKGGPLWQQALAIASMAAVGPLCLDWSPARRSASAQLCGLAVFSFLAVCPGLFFRPHYFILLLPAMGLLAGASLDRCYQLVCERSYNSWLRAIPGVLVLVIVGITLLSNRDYLLRAAPDDVLRSTYGMNPFSEAAVVGKWLRQNTPENETIAVLGSEPEIYFYARRKSATGYIYTYPLMEDQPRALAMQREMAHEIEAAAPRYLVYVHNVNSWANTKRSSLLIFEWFWRYQKQYQIVGWSEANLQSSVVRWGVPQSWPPRSPGWMAVYQRIDPGIDQPNDQPNGGDPWGR